MTRPRSVRRCWTATPARFTASASARRLALFCGCSAGASARGRGTPSRRSSTNRSRKRELDGRTGPAADVLHRIGVCIMPRSATPSRRAGGDFPTSPQPAERALWLAYKATAVFHGHAHRGRPEVTGDAIPARQRAAAPATALPRRAAALRHRGERHGRGGRRASEPLRAARIRPGGSPEHVVASSPGKCYKPPAGSGTLACRSTSGRPSTCGSRQSSIRPVDPAAEGGPRITSPGCRK